jgi:translation initiation factor IF-1
MNIDDLKNSLGNVDVKMEKVINELFNLSIYNNSLLRVILSNQAKILNQINKDVDEEQFERDCVAAALKEADETKIDIISRFTK